MKLSRFWKVGHGLVFDKERTCAKHFLSTIVVGSWRLSFPSPANSPTATSLKSTRLISELHTTATLIPAWFQKKNNTYTHTWNFEMYVHSHAWINKYLWTIRKHYFHNLHIQQHRSIWRNLLNLLEKQVQQVWEWGRSSPLSSSWLESNPKLSPN